MVANPHCVLAVTLPDIDLVVEGTAAKVTDPTKLERIAKLYADGGWPAEARDGAVRTIQRAQCWTSALAPLRGDSDQCDRTS